MKRVTLLNTNVNKQPSPQRHEHPLLCQIHHYLQPFRNDSRRPLTVTRHNSLGVRCVPFAAPYTAHFSVSYGENRPSDSVGQGRLHALRSSLLHFKLDTKCFFTQKFLLQLRFPQVLQKEVQPYLQQNGCDHLLPPQKLQELNQKIR